MITIPKHPKGKKKEIRSAVVPAPIAGIDTRHPLAKMPPETCVYAYNLVPDAYGLSIRKGYSEYANKLDILPASGTPDPFAGVKTIVVFSGTVENTNADDRLFGVTNVGIFDITDPNIPPIEKIAFDVQNETAGNGVSCHYIDEGGHEFMLYADERNGLFTYEQATDTWSKATGITGGIVVEEIVFVMVHKLRLWFVQRDTADAWYMPVDSMQGEATKFTFGSKFAHGGYLRGLYNWTFDGGAGVDDYLVAIASSGDVLPYKGEDPSTSDSWSLVGSYFVGDLPVGRRIATQAGGQLFVLSSYGLTSMNDLLTGVDTRNVYAESVAAKIAPVIRAHLQETRYDRGWELIFAPAEGIYIINSPPRKSYPQIQYVMSLASEGWGMWRDLPAMCYGEWAGRIYFGYGDQVFLLNGYRDNVKKIKIDPDDWGIPIKFSVMTNFSPLDGSAQYKMIQFIRPDMLSEYQPTYGCKAIYDYAINEVVLPPTTGDIFEDDDLWDVAIWDEAIWGNSNPKGHSNLVGSTGMGRAVAIALMGEAVEEIKLLSIDVMWTTGGMM